MTVRIDIIAFAQARLRAINPAPAEVELEPTGDPSSFPAFAIYDNGHRVLEREAGQTRYRLSLTVEGYVERGDGQEASDERAVLQAAAVAALLSDDQFGGLIEDIDDEDLRMTTAVLASSRRLMFAQDFAIQFVSKRTNPALPA